MTHVVPMLSLDKAFTDEDVVDFVERAYAGSCGSLPRIRAGLDGGAENRRACRLSLRYEEGKAGHGGDARRRQVGEDVTANASTVADIPHTS